METKTIIYRGVKFRRYSGRRYYVPSGDAINAGWTSLHRQIWIDSNGPIPVGMHIHHKDHDPENNSIENLETVSAGAHALHHYMDRRDLLEKQSAWAKSEKGRAVLKDNIRKCRESAKQKTLTCGNCGESFETRHPRKKYCSPECRGAKDYKQIKKSCPICGNEFWAKSHKTKEVKTCSYSCGWALRKKGSGL